MFNSFTLIRRFFLLFSDFFFKLFFLSFFFLPFLLVYEHPILFPHSFPKFPLKSNFIAKIHYRHTRRFFPMTTREQKSYPLVAFFSKKNLVVLQDTVGMTFRTNPYCKSLFNESGESLLLSLMSLEKAYSFLFLCFLNFLAKALLVLDFFLIQRLGPTICWPLSFCYSLNTICNSCRTYSGLTCCFYI